MAIPARISIVTLGVADLVRARTFYEALGWELCASSMDEICWFRTADSYLGLFPTDDLAEDAQVAAALPGGFRGVTLAINVDRPDDVSAALEGAVSAGGSLLKPATDVIFGVSGYFADPDGHVWEVAFNPSFPLDEAGSITIP
jgi:uncharacterized protein